MIETLYNELESLPLKHHELEMTENGTILLRSRTCDKEGIDEVMMVKEYASKYDVLIHWDGRHIEIY